MLPPGPTIIPGSFCPLRPPQFALVPPCLVVVQGIWPALIILTDKAAG